MNSKTKNGYVAAVVCAAIAVVLLLILIEIGWNLAGQFIGVFTLLFGGLSIGGFLWPDTAGQIAAQILKNIGENQRSNSYRQSQSRPRNSPQSFAQRDVNITQHFHGSKKGGRRRK